MKNNSKVAKHDKNDNAIKLFIPAVTSGQEDKAEICYILKIFVNNPTVLVDKWCTKTKDSNDEALAILRRTSQESVCVSTACCTEIN